MRKIMLRPDHSDVQSTVISRRTTLAFFLTFCKIEKEEVKEFQGSHIFWKEEKLETGSLWPEFVDTFLYMTVMTTRSTASKANDNGYIAFESR